MTYTEIKNIFACDENPNEAILRLSVAYPCFSGSDLISVFKTVCDNYHILITDAVWSPTVIELIFYSDKIFRTLYQIMFMSEYWDNEILFQPCFINAFTIMYNDFKFKNIILPRKQIGRVENIAYDLLDKLDDFKDRLTDKIKMHSGV